MKPRELNTEKEGRDPSGAWVKGTRASGEEVEGAEREREEAGEKLRSVPIEVKKEQENKAAEPTNRRQSGQDRQKMSDQKIGSRDGKEKWRRSRGDSERRRRPGGNKR